MSLDFDKICRICLQLKKDTYDIFKNYCPKQTVLYSQMLDKCTEIKLHEGDGLPSIICKDCSKQLKKAYAFNKQCVESDKKLVSLVENKLSFKEGVKTEDSEYKYEVTLHKEYAIGNSALVPLREEICGPNGEVKLEPNYDDDDCWNADDNIILEDIKSQKIAELSSCQDLDKQQKKKRGRKKKVYSVGNVQQLSESKLPHQCDICGKFLSTRSNLNQHKICHTDLRPYKCPDCPSSFRGYSALFQHRKIHTGETPYHCEYCSKQFTRRTGLVNHIRTHTGEKSYSCDICFKNFVQSAQLSIHMKRHKGDKTYLCQECGKGFPIKADLRVHQRVHNGEKPYSCHLCPKTFATAGNLSIHVRIHNKEVRYHCKECQRGFVTCSAYNVHLKRHKGQRDHRCDCGKTFYTSSALKQHKVVHTGEKKYQCVVCSKKFSQTSHLNRHFRKDHGKLNASASTNSAKQTANQNGKPVLNLLDVSKFIAGTVKCEGS